MGEEGEKLQEPSRAPVLIVFFLFPIASFCFNQKGRLLYFNDAIKFRQDTNGINTFILKARDS